MCITHFVRFSACLLEKILRAFSRGARLRRITPLASVICYNFYVVDLSFLEQEAPVVARQLIGWRLFVVDSGQKVGGTIVETEAYTEADAASHSYRGKTPRNEIMFGPAGHVYVYFTYGMHWCANIVVGPECSGEAVLIRSILPEKGLNIIRARRSRPDSELTNGPAKLCQALNITGSDNGLILNASRIVLEPPSEGADYQVETSRRIGIRHDRHRLWRFSVI